MTSIVNHALLYSGATSYTVQQASTGKRLLLLIASSFDWYGNDGSVPCSFNGSALTPIATYNRLTEGSNNNTAIYTVTDAALPAAAGAVPVEFSAAYFSRLAIIELADAPQNTGLLAISNVACTAATASTAVTPAALDLVISALAINTNNTITSAAPSTLLGVETSTGSETRFALASYLAPDADVEAIGFGIEYGSSQPGTLTVIRIPVSADPLEITPGESAGVVYPDAPRFLWGRELELAPAEVGNRVALSAFGWQTSDVGVLRNVVDPQGDALSARISAPPVNGSADLTWAGNLVYLPQSDTVETDSFWVEPWADGRPGPTPFQVALAFDAFAVAPTFVTAPVLSVDEGAVYTFNGTVNDVNGDTITLLALMKPAWLSFTILSGTTFRLTGTPPEEASTSYRVVLQASDAYLSTQLDYNITVNRAPFFSSANSVTWNNWGSGTYQVTTDTPGATLTLVSPPAGVSINGSGLVTGTIPAAGDTAFTVRATHNGLSRDLTVAVSVDGRPVFYGATAVSVSAGAIDPITFEANDPEGNPVTLTGITIPAGLAFVPIAGVQTTSNGQVYTGVLTGNLTAGTHSVVIRASTTASGATDRTFTFTVVALPVINAQPQNQSVATGQMATFTATVTGASGYQWYDASTSSAIPGATAASYSRGAVADDNGKAFYCVASNGAGGTVQTNTVTLIVTDSVVVPPTYTKPVFSSASVVDADNWSTLVYQAAVTPPESVVQLLAPVTGVSWNTGAKQATLAFPSAGSFSFTLRAINGTETTDHTVAVLVDGRPVFYGPASYDIPAGAITPITIEVKDPEGATITLVPLELPDGLTFSASPTPINTANGLVYTGTLTGTLPGGAHVARFRATAALGSGETERQIAINAVSEANEAPQITNVNTLTVIAGQRVQLTMTATDANGDAIAWSLASAYDWIYRSGAELIVEPPEDTEAGPYQAFASASDGTLSTHKTLNVYVQAAISGGLTPSDTEFDTPMRRTVVVGRVDRGAPRTFEQDPGERYDYMIDARRWLELDQLAGVAWLPDDGILLENGGFSPGQAVAWLSGGSAGEAYRVACTLTTLGGRVHKVVFYVSVQSEDL